MDMPQSKRHYHHGNLQQALIDAAVALIQQGGQESLSLRAVARKIGVSTAAPYRHFSSKEALLAVVAEQGYRMLSQSIREATAASGADPLAILREGGVGYVRFATTYPAHYSVMFSPGLVRKSHYPELAEAAAESLGLLISHIRGAQAAGLIDARDPRELALAAWAGVHGLSTLISSAQVRALGGAAASVDEQTRFVADALLMGLVHRPADRDR